MTDALFTYSLRLADDAVVLGHRLSEWCSNGPFLEEDIATINTALDYIGRANMLYTYAARVEGAGRSEDDLCFMRDAREYRNLLINELPNGDFGFTTMRQFLLDAFYVLFFEQLKQSQDENLAAISAKSIKECHYHLRRSRDWVLRLGDGTEESRQRMQTALDDLWGFSHELFEMDALELQLVEQGVAVDRAALRPAWLDIVSPILTQATLVQPEDGWRSGGGRQGVHTEHLGHMLAEMQVLPRTYPGVKW